VIDAACRGKLSRELEGMEDLLTSTVFGLLKYLPPNEGLLPFLSLAAYTDGQNPLSTVRAQTVQYTFWPWWQFGDCHGAEPDLVIDLVSDDQRRYKVLVEVKFRSEKSSLPDSAIDVPKDQLGREWDNLSRLCQEEKAEPVLVYLTADYGIPLDEIEESRNEYSFKRPDATHKFQCAWLSWRHLPDALRSAEHPIAKDLVKLIERFGLTLFKGIHFIHAFDWNWNFRSIRTIFDFRCADQPTWAWTFKK